MGQVSRFHVEVDFSGEPFFADLAEQGGDEAEQRGFVWKEGCDAGSALEFLIDAFDGVACAHAALVGGREGKDSEALRNIFLHPEGEFRSRFGVGIHERFEAGLGGVEIVGVEDGADVRPHALTHIETRDVGLSIELEMELAPLPWDGRENGHAGGGEPAMGIADNEDEAMKSACLEGSEEGAPVDFGLAEGDADTEDGALSIGADPDGDKNGAVEKLAALADLFVSGVENHVGIASQRAIPPGLEFDIELGGAGAHLGGADGVSAEFLNDFGHFAGGHALDVHLGEGEKESLFAAGSLFQGGGIKIHAVANLRNAQEERADTGGKGFGLESIGSPQAIIATLIRPGLKNGGAFLDHGLVDEQAQALGKAGGAFGGEELQNGVQKIRINLVGHVCVFVGCVCLHPNRKPHWPAPGELRASPFRGRLRSARYARLRSAAPGRGAQIAKSPNYRTNFTPARRVYPWQVVSGILVSVGHHITSHTPRVLRLNHSDHHHNAAVQYAGQENPRRDSMETSVQISLTRTGYYNGPIDGSIGPMSRRAISNYQADRGMRVTGNPDSTLLDSLGLQ